MYTIINVKNYAKKIARVCGLVIYIGSVQHCVVKYIGDFVFCIGSSMEPTIYSGQVLFAENISIHQKKINKGDIVVTLSPINPGHYVCKRVKALAGDKVRTGFFYEVVPKGHVWLEGDNTYNSVDSRSYGPVPQGLIKGRAVCRLWPFTNIEFFTNKAKHRT